jgi:hypothetical protein
MLAHESEHSQIVFMVFLCSLYRKKEMDLKPRTVCPVYFCSPRREEER